MAVMIVAGYFMLRWSFERGATSYIKQADQERLQTLAEPLGDYFRDHQSWQAFTGQEDVWRAWLVAHDRSGPLASNGEQAPPAPGGLSNGRPDQPPIGQPPLGQPPIGQPPSMQPPGPAPDSLPPQGATLPFFLLDAERRQVVGKVDLEGTLQPIVVGEGSAALVVGYIGLPPPPARLGDFWQDPIVTQQRALLLCLALASLLVSVLAAIPLSALLSRRIIQLHETVTDLSQGLYQARAKVVGNDELACLAENLNKLAQTLDDSQRQRQQVTADISHELRTPVASLQAYIEAMQEGIIPLTPETLPKLHDQTQRLSSLINDLYQLSLADAGALSYQMMDCDLAQLMERIVATELPGFRQRQLSLTLVKCHQCLPQVWADEQRITQLFCNLLGNSRRYTDSPGEVEIIVGVEGDWVTVTVQDSAPGVAAELQQRLTERLFRVEVSRHRRSGGAGLGLNLCAAIVKAHGGQLLFSDSPQGGLAVTVKLPALMSDRHE